MPSRAALTVVADRPLTVAEFFAGAGLARIALESAGFRVAWSNDHSEKKHRMYAGHFRDAPDAHTFVVGDIGQVAAAELPDGLALAWASFPCTDLSLAGNGRGINEGESRTFWDFIVVIGELGSGAPPVVCLENVPGLATSHGGDDLRTAVRAMNELGYSVDVLALDARRFVPQSRERLFLVCAKNPPAEQDDPTAGPLRPGSVRFVHRDAQLRTHAARLPEPPAPLSCGFGGVVEEMADDDPRWWDAARTTTALASLSDVQAARIELLKQHRRPVYRTGFRRTRRGVAVWEFREDDISGCLRTVRGGSSRQSVLQLRHGAARLRWMTPLEYARLMGVGDYTLGTVSAPQAIYGFGDAVCVPVVEWIARNYLRPLITGEIDDVSRLGSNERPAVRAARPR